MQRAASGGSRPGRRRGVEFLGELSVRYRGADCMSMLPCRSLRPRGRSDSPATGESTTDVLIEPLRCCSFDAVCNELLEDM